MPADDVQERALRQQRPRPVRVVVDDVPPEVPVRAVQHPGRVVRQDRLQALPLAEIVQVRLERGDMRVFLEQEVSVVAHVALAGRDVEVLVVAHVGRDQLVLRFDPPGIEGEADGGAVDDLPSDRVVVQVEADLRPGLDQAAVAVREYVAVLAERVLVQETPQGAVILGFVIDDAGHGVVHYREALGRRLGLDRLDPAVLRQARVRLQVAPPVRRLRGDDERLRNLHDPVRRADMPLVHPLELHGRRQVGGIAARRAGFHPLGDGGDLGIAQRLVFLEILDADVLVDVPGRHDALGDLFPDRPRPRPGLLVRQERHRRDGAGPVTHLARPLQDGRHVPGERHLGSVLRNGGRGRRDDGERGAQHGGK